ncbi:MAG: hypothetical protein ABSG93_20360 [Solirubrobacteraceae bacterium]
MAPVALAEGMDGVDLGVVVRQAFQELLAAQAVEAILMGEVSKQCRQVGTDVLRQREQVAPLRDAYRAQLAGPQVDVAEDVAVCRLQVGEVKIAGSETPLELRYADGAECRLALGKRGRVAQVQKVSQQVGAGIGVWIGGHRRNVSRVPASRLGACRDEQLTERLASGYQTCCVVELCVGQFPTPPAAQECLGYAGIETLGANGRQCVLGCLGARRHAPILPSWLAPGLGSNFGSNLSELELI